ncbi:MAG: rod shape-determining protein RodA [Deltaproteobacteria bacterium]|nr:rod shape-determining protein RodA [Deltaproteobacteria bacterium]
MPNTYLDSNVISSVRKFEWFLCLNAITLAIIGIVSIYSATIPMGSAGRSFVIKQTAWLSLGVVLLILFSFVDYRILDRWGSWVYIFILVALISVSIFGRVTAGSRRWIDFGLMRFQPSEFAKLAIVIVLAKSLSNRTRGPLDDWTEIFRNLALVLVPAVFVTTQPDLGTAIAMSLVAITMAMFVGLSKRIWSAIAGLAVVCVPLIYIGANYFLLDYQKRRLLTFINPDQDPLGAGYQIIQSQIAIGSGELFGKGFLKGTQNQLMFLPVKHTDFIFAVLSEEWGFIGCVIILMLFMIFILRGLAIADRARDDFGTLLAVGCIAIIFWHVAINVGMVMGLVPVVGVPLSFVSYGGSSLLSSFLVTAILSSISSRRFSCLA